MHDKHKQELPPADSLAEAADTGDSVEAYAAINNREEIAKLAYKYYEERGYKHGYHHEDWQRAEQEIRNRRRG